MAKPRSNGAAEAQWPAGKVKFWPLAKIVPYPKNPRVHAPEQISALAADMVSDGVTMPILVDEGGVVIAGHGRLLAAQENGFERYPVVVARGWTEEQKRSARIRDNQRTLQSAWDVELICGEIGDLKLAGYDIPLLGFPETELRGWGIALGTEGPDPEAAPEPPVNPVTRPGDLWLLGGEKGHRILCGDATSESDVARCLNGARPHLMVTDPPYGVNYDPAWRAEPGKLGAVDGSFLSTEGVRKGAVTNDARADWRECYDLFPGDIAYVWHGALFSSVVETSLHASRFLTRAQIVWAKQHAPISRGDYHWRHECCWYMVRKGKTARWNSDRKQNTVWDIANMNAFGGREDDEKTGHGTQKPIECMKRPIENNSRAGDAVYDPFVGSGTTIIAAEMTRRRALTMDIDPVYVDVAVERWAKFTGREPILEATGQTFAEVQDARFDKDADVGGSICDGLAAVRERVAAGGPSWTPGASAPQKQKGRSRAPAASAKA